MVDGARCYVESIYGRTGLCRNFKIIIETSTTTEHSAHVSSDISSMIQEGQDMGDINDLVTFFRRLLVETGGWFELREFLV